METNTRIDPTTQTEGGLVWDRWVCNTIAKHLDRFGPRLMPLRKPGTQSTTQSTPSRGNWDRAAAVHQEAYFLLNHWKK